MVLDDLQSTTGDLATDMTTFLTSPTTNHAFMTTPKFAGAVGLHFSPKTSIPKERATLIMDDFIPLFLPPQSVHRFESDL